MNQGPPKHYRQNTDFRNRRVDIKTIERESTKKLCPKCNLQGIKSVLGFFQINDQESLLMCKNVECTYMPTSSNLESHIVKRDLAQLTVRKKKLSSSSSASSVSSFCSYSRSASVRSLDAENFLQHLSKPGGLASSKNCLLPSTPTPEVSERKTLVPFATFPAGHAHNFYSFQTSKLERLKKKQLVDTEGDPINKLDLVNLTRNINKRAASQSSDFETGKSTAPLTSDSGASKAKQIKIVYNPPGNLPIGVLKQRIIQDREAKTKDLDIRPVGLLEDLRKDYSPQYNSFAPIPESGKTHIAAINEQLLRKFSSVSSESTDIKYSTALSCDIVQQCLTPGTYEIKAGDKSSLSSLFPTNQEELKEVSELDEFYINNFEDF